MNGDNGSGVYSHYYRCDDDYCCYGYIRCHLGERLQFLRCLPRHKNQTHLMYHIHLNRRIFHGEDKYELLSQISLYSNIPKEM